MKPLSGKKVVRLDSEIELPIVDRELQELGAELVKLGRDVDPSTLALALQGAELLLTCYAPVTQELLESATRLKGIVKYGVGIDAIDIEAAKARRVPVVNIPEYAESTVAEGAFAMMIALAKKMRKIQKKMDTSGWMEPTSEWMGADLAGKTLGLVGSGKIGSHLARMAGAGFQMKVLAFDPYVSSENMGRWGIQKRIHLEAMVAECDFISIHCTLSPATRGLFGKTALQAMKPTAFLVNCSRGAIVDEAALLEVLYTRQIAGAALDVYSQEPLTRSGHPLSRLFEMDNVVLWPHLTFYTKEAMERLESETLERAVEILQGKPVVIKSHDPRLRSQAGEIRFS